MRTPKLTRQSTERKLSRAERNDDVRRRLFEAACRIVGENGYAEASVARITALAGVAQGTFYNHFANRQVLLDSLLPSLGISMAHYIQSHVEGATSDAERENARFRAFFDYLHENPGFLRILNEAEFCAPEAYRAHISNMAAPFLRILMRARDRGELEAYSDAELEVVVHILMGARGYLSQHYGSHDAVDEHVFTAYAKLLGRGLFVDGK